MIRVLTNRMGIRYDHTHTNHTVLLLIFDTVHTVALDRLPNAIRAQDATHGHTPAGYPMPFRTRYALQVAIV
jgi:hypothetical protein